MSPATWSAITRADEFVRVNFATNRPTAAAFLNVTAEQATVAVLTARTDRERRAAHGSLRALTTGLTAYLELLASEGATP